MTEEIDLDELDVEGDDDQGSNPGDWFWRDDGDLDGEHPVAETSVPGSDREEGESGPDERADTDAATGEGGDERARVPHVPYQNKDKPVGIPVEGGGAGAKSTADTTEEPPDNGESTDINGAGSVGTDASETGDAGGTATEASGPHGGDVDDMTMAISYEAMKRLEDPRLVIGDAEAWADWVGIVGDVEAFVINKFQRDNRVDVDFFNGSREGPAERLAGIDSQSMFYAERMVLVGLPNEKWMAETANWEFVPLSEAAGKADWNLVDGPT